MHRRRALVGLLWGCALLLALGSRGIQLGQPFGYGFDGWLGAMHGNAARHFAREGFVRLRFAPYLEPGPVDPARDRPHLHHPPTVLWIAGLSVRAAGVREPVLRLAPSLATLAALGLCGALAAAHAGALAGALAALVFACLPMMIIFGGIVNYEPWVLAASLACWFAWRRYDRAPGPRALALLAAAFALAVALDWFGAYVGVAIGLDALLRSRERRRTAAVLALALAGLAVVAAVLAWFAWVREDSLASLWAWAQHRTGSATSDVGAGHFGLRQWFARHVLYLRTLYGPGGWAVLAALGGLLATARALPAAARTAALWWIPGLLAAAVFPQAAYQHGFLTFPLVVPIALGIAFGSVTLGRALAARARLAPLLVALPLAIGLGTSALSGFAALEGLPVASGRVHIAGLPLPASWHIPPAGIPTPALAVLGRELAARTPPEARIAVPDLDLNRWVPVGFYADRRLVYGCDSPARVRASGAGWLAIPRAEIGRWAPVIEPLQRAGARVRLTPHLAVWKLASP
ncbi:MAG: hypothetical protein D6776_10105 [Planctomycetota bacterium]|nr:MAG: hypothetical protein D6776_10105 [Planctomycetota bacterium]